MLSSAAGSLVSYVLGITTLDPIKNGYYFERFLNPERIEFPDVDTDISKEDRPRAIEYLLNKYGSDYVAQIVTFSVLKLKSTIKEVARTLNIPYEEVNVVTKKIPDSVDGKVPDLKMLMDIYNNPDAFIGDLGTIVVGQVKNASQMLIDLFAKYPLMKDAVEHLTGCIAGTGIHAGGVIVSGKPLHENIPLMTGSDTAVLPLVQMDMEDLGFYNAIKIDALGLATLTQVRKAMDIIGLDDDWFDSEDFSDPDVYSFLRDGYTTDVFQMSSHNATKMIRDMKINSFEGLTIVNAGNRPGPLSKNKITGKSLVEEYIERNNSGNIPSLHPAIDGFLSETNGCLWYQEQCMKLGQVMAGYSLGKADLRIRKVLGKKKIEKIPEIHAEFIYGKSYDYDSQSITDKLSNNCIGAIANGFSEELSTYMFELMKEFAKYSFNKAHSGAYAALAYKTAWLKFYYPHEWTIACLSVHDDQDKKIATISEARRMGLQVLSPDINLSDYDFKIEINANGEKCLRYGLGSISRVGLRVFEYIEKFRPYTSFDEFYTKIHGAERDVNPETGKLMNNPLNKAVEMNLIKTGVFDEIMTNRYSLINYYMDTIRKDKKFEPLNTKKYNRKVKLAMEKEVTGVYLSEHPLDPFPYQNIDEMTSGDKILIAGIILKVTVKQISRGQSKGQDFAIVIMETKDGREAKVVIFTKEYNKFKDRLVKKQIVIIEGEVNKEYDNIKANRVLKLVPRSKEKPNDFKIDMPVRESLNSKLENIENPIDDFIKEYKGVDNE